MLSIAIFLLTIFAVIFRPFNLGIGTCAIIGAVLSLVCGTVSFGDTLEAFSIVWDASLAFLGIIIFSLVLDEIGFFEHAALRAALACGGDLKKLFFALMALCGVVSALFANDAAVLILAPIILAQTRALNLPPRSALALLLATGFMSDSASLPFVFSNLTNIISAGFFGISFWGYFSSMWAAFLLSFVASTLISYIILRKDLSAKLDISVLRSEFKVVANKQLFIFTWIFFALLLVGYGLGDVYALPFCVFALGGAVVFMGICARLGAIRARVIFTRTPWQILWFSLGLYIVVWGLKNAQYSELLSSFLLLAKESGELVLVLASGLTSSVLSSLMNNLPAMMLMDISLQSVGSNKAIYAAIIGCNVGVKFTHFGSLATLLWLYLLKSKNCEISIKTYLIFSFKITLPVLFITLFGVYLWA